MEIFHPPHFHIHFRQGKLSWIPIPGQSLLDDEWWIFRDKLRAALILFIEFWNVFHSFRWVIIYSELRSWKKEFGLWINCWIFHYHWFMAVEVGNKILVAHFRRMWTQSWRFFHVSISARRTFLPLYQTFPISFNCPVRPQKTWHIGDGIESRRNISGWKETGWFLKPFTHKSSIHLVGSIEIIPFETSAVPIWKWISLFHFVQRWKTDNSHEIFTKASMGRH